MSNPRTVWRSPPNRSYDEEEAPLSVLTADTVAAIEQLRADARAAAEASRAPSSERAYAADWRDFCAFAARIGRQRLPAEAETVALYVADLTHRGRRPATIARKLAAIAVYHRSTDHPTPTDHDVVRAVVRGTRRQLGVAQPQKTALEIDALRTVVLAIPDDLRGMRDRALLLVCWAAALRRSELVALEVGDLDFEPEGVVLTIRRSKTDPEGAGVTVAVPLGGEEATCPVGALRRWLEAAAVSEGRVFRRIDRHANVGPTLSDRALAEIVASRAAAAGLEGRLRRPFAARRVRDGGRPGRSLGGRDHAPRPLEECADCSPLYPPGRPLGQ
jgi:integrase